MPTNGLTGLALSRSLQKFILVSVVAVAASGAARGQAIAEYANTTSSSASTATAAGSIKVPTASLPIIQGVQGSQGQGGQGSQAGSPHLVAPVGPPPEVVNRNALEQHAGKDAGKLLLRSTPSPAQVLIDGAFVGNTPMLLILAPGKYRVEVRGQRLESAQRTVDLLPRETREVALRMEARYPTTVSMR